MSWVPSSYGEETWGKDVATNVESWPPKSGDATTDARAKWANLSTKWASAAYITTLACLVYRVSS